jgi:phage/plasmid-associated DNA primase
VLVLVQSFFGRDDPALTGRLVTELPGILNWSLHGYRRLRERGHFIQPASAREAVEDLEMLASPTKAFIKDRCRMGPGQSVSVELIFQTWCMWCDSIGRREHGTIQTFGRDLKAVIPSLRMTRPRDGEVRYRVYEGIGLDAKAALIDEVVWGFNTGPPLSHSARFASLAKGRRVQQPGVYLSSHVYRPTDFSLSSARSCSSTLGIGKCSRILDFSL